MAAEAAWAFAAVTPTESVLPPEKIPLIVLAPAEILLISITGRMTGVVSISSDKTVEIFASVFLVESKASPCYAFRCPANDMRIPFQTIYKTHIHGYGNHYSKKSGEFMFLRWICRALRDCQNQSQGLDFATNLADGKVSSPSMLSRLFPRQPALSTSCAVSHPGGGAFAVLAVF